MSEHRSSPGDDDPSEELVRRAQQGEGTALDRLLRRSLERLERLVRARTSPALRRTEETGDFVQSALREAVRDLPRFEYRGRGSFHRWLSAIVENKIRHRARDRRRAGRAPDGAPPGPGGPDELPADERVTDDDRGPDQAAIAAEVAEHVRQAIEELDDDERDLIVWRQFHELSSAQVAHLLDTTEAAASKRYLRALRRLEGLLAARGISTLG